MTDDLEKDQVGNSNEQEKHKRRMREDWDNLIDDIVQEGKDKGLFDNLSGKGKPLKLRSNQFEAGRELANAIMKDNDVPPSWIMDRNQILEERSALRAEIKGKWGWHTATHLEAPADRRERLALSWDDACQAWQETIQLLNKRIETYNLKRPAENLEIFKIRFAEELDRAEAQRWLP